MRYVDHESKCPYYQLWNELKKRLLQGPENFPDDKERLISDEDLLDVMSNMEDQLLDKGLF